MGRSLMRPNARLMWSNLCSMNTEQLELQAKFAQESGLKAALSDGDDDDDALTKDVEKMGLDEKMEDDLFQS